MPNTSSALERLLTTCVFNDTFDARELPAAFKRICGIMADQGLRYAAAGRLALARYRAAQCTDVIVLRIDVFGGCDGILSRLDREMCSVSTGSTIRLKAELVTNQMERRLLALASPVEWLGTTTMIAAPEHLLWLALSSPDREAAVDAIHLLQSPHIDWERFVALGAMDDPSFVRRGLRARRKAEATRNSTYSASVARRLERLSRGQLR